ncbi:uncharacterized protein METZ01_LOCUS409830, partial [marine metagenome]
LSAWRFGSPRDLGSQVSRAAGVSWAAWFS